MSTRNLRLVAERRATHAAKRPGSRRRHSLKVNPDEVRKAVATSQAVFNEKVRILDDHKFGRIDSDGDDHYFYLFGEGNWDSLLKDLINVCEKHGIDPQWLICGLRFDLLDTPTITAG
jgi:hypothetical protein